MGNNKMINPFKEPLNLYLIVIAVLVAILATYDLLLGFLGILLLFGLVFFNWISDRSRSKKWRKYIEKYSMNIDNAARYAVFNLPVPLVVVDIDGKINWYNSKFTDLLDEKSVMGKSLSGIIGGLQIEQLKNHERQSGIKVGERIFDEIGRAHV